MPNGKIINMPLRYVPIFLDEQGGDIHSSTVEGADGTDGTRPYIKIVSSTVAGAEGTDGTRPYKWHSVFGLCSFSKMKSFLKIKFEVFKHRRKVNGLIKLERNLWISDKADQLGAAFASGDMHDMYKQLGAITNYAKNKTSSQKICRVSNSEVPLSLIMKRSLPFVRIFLRPCQPKPSLMVM